MRAKIICGLFCILFELGTVSALKAQGTAFTYQGQLNNGGSAATGSFDLRFTLYDAITNGNAVGLTRTNFAVAVNNGLFTTTLDMGGIFTGTNYWLELAVRTNGTAGFVTLAPRQPVSPTPYAIFANTASNLTGILPASQLSGALPSAQISGTYSGAVIFSNAADHFAGAFSGDGSSLSNLNATRVTTGTVADARLSSNVPLLNGSQTYSGVNVFTNIGNSFRGSFFGNGLVGWIVTNTTSFQATVDTGYVLTSAQLVTVTLPAAPNVGDIVRLSGAGAGGWKLGLNSGQSVIGNFLSYSNSYWTSAQTSDYWQAVASSADGTKLVAATQGNGLFIFSGGIWTPYTLNPTGGSGVASSADGSKLFATVSGASGGVYVFTNSTTGWVLPTGTPAGSFQAVACSADGTHVVAVTSNNVSGLIYTSVNAGQSWTSRLAVANLAAVASSADGTKLVAAANANGYIYTSTDSGATWTLRNFASANWSSLASSADGTKLAGVYGNGYVYTSHDSGATWGQSGSLQLNWSSVSLSADGIKLAATVRGGGIYVSSDAGATWKQTSAPTQTWNSIAASADGTRLAAAVYNSSSGIYVSQASSQASSQTSSGSISGGQGTAVELQYIGNGQFMPVSSAGTLWVN